MLQFEQSRFFLDVYIKQSTSIHPSTGYRCTKFVNNRVLIII